MKIVTSASNFIDIDALAGIVGYSELLNLRGIPARVISTTPYNQSISKSVHDWGWNIERSYRPAPADQYIRPFLQLPLVCSQFSGQSADLIAKKVAMATILTQKSPAYS